MKKWVTHDGVRMLIGSPLWRAWHVWSVARSKAVKQLNAERAKRLAATRGRVVREALSLVGIHEVPMGSNGGPAVHMIQSSTGQYGAPWCVSTVQYIWKKAGLGTWADDTAGAYFLEDYARQHGAVIARPVAGCSVVYHIGDGHAGTVVAANRNGTFWAVEGNWGSEVVHILRNPRYISCTFILRPELR